MIWSNSSLDTALFPLNRILLTYTEAGSASVVSAILLLAAAGSAIPQKSDSARHCSITRKTILKNSTQQPVLC
jgi:hypothetical protein